MTAAILTEFQIDMLRVCAKLGYWYTGTRGTAALMAQELANRGLMTEGESASIHGLRYFEITTAGRAAVEGL